MTVIVYSDCDLTNTDRCDRRVHVDMIHNFTNGLSWLPWKHVLSAIHG